MNSNENRRQLEVFYTESGKLIKTVADRVLNQSWALERLEALKSMWQMSQQRIKSDKDWIQICCDERRIFLNWDEE